jgi:hypothetical protein
MKLAIGLIGALALVAAAAPALAAEKPKAAARCFTPDQVQGHKVGDGHTLFLKVAGSTVYRVDMVNNCLGGVSSTDPLTIGQSAGASGGICEPGDLDVRAELGGGGLPSHCRIDKITRLTPAQASVLPKDLPP